jgi:beta-alanine--pyruvate transaminase
MGATVVQDYIYESMLENADAPIELFHGYTYSGHPVACAAALATLDIYQDEGLFDNAAKMSPVIEQAAHSLKGTKNVADIRNLGVIAAIELEPRGNTIGARGFETMKKAWEMGLMVRANGDTLAFSPPLIVNESQVDEMFTTVKQAIELVD